jgi:hypothetical protein
MTANAYYLADGFTALDNEEDRTKLVQRLRQYLEVRNLTLLLGNGCSIPHGAPLIQDTKTIVDELDKEPFRLAIKSDHERARATLDHLLPSARKLGVESLLAILNNVRANAQLLGTSHTIGGHVVTGDDAATLERLIKKWIYHRCRALNATSDDDLRYHKELFRRILLRSTTLPRAKVFTTNYDLLIERALDYLGVLYFDGFLGTIDRTLHSESYHYDLYYPGETTEGRVSRVDRVLHLYKMHGSINWRRRATAALDVHISHTTPEEAEYGDVMVYPSPLKITEMNGYPYAEMFRHFSGHIHQPQSALLTIGYSFQDDHINRLIYQALSIPSFVLIIVTPSIREPSDKAHPEAQHEIWRLIHHVRSKRILVVAGGAKGSDGQYTSGAGTLKEFSTTWLPDISELNVEAHAREETVKALMTLTPPAPKPSS